jgi:hypothetical protein
MPSVKTKQPALGKTELQSNTPFLVVHFVVGKFF